MDMTIPIAEEAKLVNTIEMTIPIAEEDKLVNTMEMTIPIAEEDMTIPIAKAADVVEPGAEIAHRMHNFESIQMLSYKSAAGIFVMEIINFIRNENVYSHDNMRTNLRHLLELLTIEDDIAKEACSIINIPQLIRIVKTRISSSGDSANCSEIFLIIKNIEKITNPKKND